MTQFGGGFTWSKQTPLYLEGNAAYSRYDPIFLVSDGTAPVTVPANGTRSRPRRHRLGLSIVRHWVVRPIFNFTLGRVVSDFKFAKFRIDINTNLDLSFLDGGELQAYGLGGALMLDYEKFSPEHDYDLEARYTNRSAQQRRQRPRARACHGRERQLVGAQANPHRLGWPGSGPCATCTSSRPPAFWGRERARTRAHEFNRLRIRTRFERARSLGNALAPVARYKFGPGMSGWGRGLAVSF